MSFSYSNPLLKKRNGITPRMTALKYGTPSSPILIYSLSDTGAVSDLELLIGSVSLPEMIALSEAYNASGGTALSDARSFSESLLELALISARRYHNPFLKQKQGLTPRLAVAPTSYILTPGNQTLFAQLDLTGTVENQNAIVQSLIQSDPISIVEAISSSGVLALSDNYLATDSSFSLVTIPLSENITLSDGTIISAIIVSEQDQGLFLDSVSLLNPILIQQDSSSASDQEQEFETSLSYSEVDQISVSENQLVTVFNILSDNLSTTENKTLAGLVLQNDNTSVYESFSAQGFTVKIDNLGIYEALSEDGENVSNVIHLLIVNTKTLRIRRV